MELEPPQDSIYPQIYKTFVVNDEEFYISDLTEDHTEQAIELISNYILPEENFCKAIQIHKKPNAMKIISDRNRDLMRERLSLACFKADTKELVGLNLLKVSVKGESSSQIKYDDPELRLLKESREFTSSLFNVYDHFQTDKFLDAYGLGVKSEFRGRGIAVELLKARVHLLKSLGLNLTVTTFTTVSSQKAAEKAGFREIFAISFEELQQNLPKFDFSNATRTHSKTYVLEI